MKLDFNFIEMIGSEATSVQITPFWDSTAIEEPHSVCSGNENERGMAMAQDEELPRYQ